MNSLNDVGKSLLTDEDRDCRRSRHDVRALAVKQASETVEVVDMDAVMKKCGEWQSAELCGSNNENKIMLNIRLHEDMQAANEDIAHDAESINQILKEVECRENVEDRRLKDPEIMGRVLRINHQLWNILEHDVTCDTTTIGKLINHGGYNQDTLDAYRFNLDTKFDTNPVADSLTAERASGTDYQKFMLDEFDSICLLTKDASDKPLESYISVDTQTPTIPKYSPETQTPTIPKYSPMVDTSTPPKSIIHLVCTIL
jgi:hypothetical protein